MARYLKDVNTLFQHIPRTGGSWVEKALDAAEIPVSRWLHRQAKYYVTIRKHALLAHYCSRDLKIIDKVFCFVRNPVSYYESAWTWMMQEGEDRRRAMASRWDWHPLGAVARCYTDDFDSWVESVLKYEPCFVTRLYEQYLGPNNTFVDYIGRTENIVDDFCYIMTQLGYEENVIRHREALEALGRVNGTPYSVKWDDRLRAQVEYSERVIIRKLPSLQGER